MRMRKIGSNLQSSFIVTGMEGEDRYRVMDCWSADQTHFAGYEIYAIDGCFLKVGTITNEGEYISHSGSKNGQTNISDPLLKEIIFFCMGKVQERKMTREESTLAS